MATTQELIDIVRAKPYVTRTVDQEDIPVTHMAYQERVNGNLLEKRIDGVQVYKVPVWTIFPDKFYVEIHIVEWSVGGTAEFVPGYDPDVLLDQYINPPPPPDNTWETDVKAKIDTAVTNHTLDIYSYRELSIQNEPENASVVVWRKDTNNKVYTTKFYLWRENGTIAFGEALPDGATPA